jgi:hypothetical protein
VTTFSTVRSMARTLVPFALLAFAQAILFFRNPEHFFNGDTLFWLWNRHHSIVEFFSGFTKLDPALWYRPLSQRAIESLLFPVAGLNPIPYRMVGFALFFSCTIAVFFFSMRVTESRRSAWFAVLAFTPHLVHKFTTYDVAFTPDLFLMLFSLGSALAYIQFLQTERRSSLVISVLLLAASLLSKETAAGLPFALAAIWFFARRKKSISPWTLVPHFLVLGCYLVLVFGVLHVRNLEIGQVFGWIPQDSTSGYQFGADENAIENIRHVFSWVFGIPAGIHGQWVFGASWILPMLETFRVVASVLAIVLLFSPRRKVLLLGVCWFLAMLAPAIFLKTHFLPYYLSAPLAGLALAGGTLLEWGYTQIEKMSPRTAIAMAVLVLAGWTKGQANPANRLALSHSLLGGAATASGRALADVRSAYPTLPKRAELVFFNESIPSAATDHASGLLFKLTYDDPDLVVRYSTTGLPAGLNPEQVFAFKWDQGHFVDVTARVRRQPDLWLPE